MGKLFELIAVEPSLKEQAGQAIKSIVGLFTQGAERLRGRQVWFEPFDESEPTESSAIQVLVTTVKQELNILQNVFGQYVDAALQKEMTNGHTEGMIAIPGFNTVLLSATALLNLEGRLKELRKVYVTIPVNDASESWIFDEQRGCFVSEKSRRIRTRKDVVYTTIAKAQGQHPEQVAKDTKDVAVGYIYAHNSSGALSPADKAGRLSRLDEMIRAVRQARERANRAEIIDMNLADMIFAHINGV